MNTTPHNIGTTWRDAAFGEIIPPIRLKRA
jgi:hypothetical protein